MPTYKLTQIPVAIQLNLVIYFQLYGTEEKIDTQKGSVTCLRSPDCMWQYGIVKRWLSGFSALTLKHYVMLLFIKYQAESKYLCAK